MIILPTTLDVLRVVTDSVATVDVYVAYVDLFGTTISADAQKTAISSVATTTVCAAPAASTKRNVKSIFFRNRHASLPAGVQVEAFNGTTAYQIHKVTLAAGEQLNYDEDGGGWAVLDSSGRKKTRSDGLVAAAVNTLNTVVLAADVINANATANTMADVTGMSFAVVAGESYWFSFAINFTSAALTTGSRWAVNVPASPTTLSYASRYTLTAIAETVNYAAAVDIPAASNASALLTGNLAIIEGHVTPSASGVVVARFASEILSSAITAKRGSLLRWVRVL